MIEALTDADRDAENLNVNDTIAVEYESVYTSTLSDSKTIELTVTDASSSVAVYAEDADGTAYKLEIDGGLACELKKEDKHGNYSRIGYPEAVAVIDEADDEATLDDDVIFEHGSAELGHGGMDLDDVEKGDTVELTYGRWQDAPRVPAQETTVTGEYRGEYVGRQTGIVIDTGDDHEGEIVLLESNTVKNRKEEYGTLGGTIGSCAVVRTLDVPFIVRKIDEDDELVKEIPAETREDADVIADAISFGCRCRSEVVEHGADDSDDGPTEIGACDECGNEATADSCSTPFCDGSATLDDEDDREICTDGGQQYCDACGGKANPDEGARLDARDPNSPFACRDCHENGDLSPLWESYRSDG